MRLAERYIGGPCLGQHSQWSSVENLESKVRYVEDEGAARGRHEGGSCWWPLEEVCTQRVNLHTTELIFGAAQSFRGAHGDIGGATKWIA